MDIYGKVFSHRYNNNYIGIIMMAKLAEFGSDFQNQDKVF